jgi:putative Ca2+/H+ antiporter (TMEM165/GDT1 family)
MQLGLAAGVFGLMFVAELPDKTMIATLIMGSRYRPLLVWIGTTLAFAVHITLAVAVGRLLQLLPRAWVEAVTALLFAGGAVYLLVTSEEEAEEEGAEEVTAGEEVEEEIEEEMGGRPWRSLRPVATAFTVIFIGEFGDLTQILAANLAARYHSPVSVWVGAMAAMASVAALGAFGGRALTRVLPLAAIRKGGGVLLAIFAVYSIVTIFTG